MNPIQWSGQWTHILDFFQEVFLQVSDGGLDHRFHLRPDGADQLLFGLHVEGQLSGPVQQPLTVHTYRKSSH